MSHYRSPSESIVGSVLSLFQLHNETINVWTHLLGAMFAIYLIYYTFHKLYREYTTTSIHDLIFLNSFLIGSIICFGSSTIFHLLSNHSSTVYSFWNRMDHLGIVIFIVSSSVTPIFYYFYTQRFYAIFYCSQSIGLGLLTIYLMTLPQFSLPSWRFQRSLIYISLGMSGVVPLMHAQKQRAWKWDNSYGLYYYILQGALYIIGAMIYAFRFPEKHYPGLFDIIGASHQIFHAFVLAGAYTHWRGILKTFRNTHFNLSKLKTH